MFTIMFHRMVSQGFRMSSRFNHGPVALPVPPGTFIITNSVNISTKHHDITTMITSHLVIASLAWIHSCVNFIPFLSLNVEGPGIIETLIIAGFVHAVASIQYDITRDIVKSHGVLVTRCRTSSIWDFQPEIPVSIVDPGIIAISVESCVVKAVPTKHYNHIAVPVIGHCMKITCTGGVLTVTFHPVVVVVVVNPSLVGITCIS